MHRPGRGPALIPVEPGAPHALHSLAVPDLATKKHAWRDERVAEEYDARRFATLLQRWKQRRDEALLLELLRAASGVRSVLDLPCGTGRMLPPLVRAGYRVAGGDLSGAMLRAGVRAGRNGKDLLGLVQADGERLPFRTGSFDAVVALRFLFHMGERERLSCLAEMRRTSSRAVIGQVRYRWTGKHFGRWVRSLVGLCPRYRPSSDRRAIARELAEAGLELERLEPVSRLFSDKAFFLARSRAGGYSS